MKKIPIQWLLIILIATPAIADGQDVLSGKKAPSYAHVREADIMWMKRIWRRIDLRQKMNHGFYFPETPSNGRKSLFDYLVAAVSEGSITAYDPGPLGFDDMFTTEMTDVQLNQLLVHKEVVRTIDPTTLQEIEKEIEIPLRSGEITMYEIKEDWFFDNQRSVMEVRIIGICPLQEVRDEETGEFRGYKRLFWVNYHEARAEMATWMSFNRQNDTESRTYDEVFQKRMFSSYVTKESNVYDRSISQYALGKEALLESDRIEKELREMEHDLWSY